MPRREPRKSASRAQAKATPLTEATIERLKRQVPSRLAQIRGERSQRRFAQDLGVFQQNVNRYERGTTPHTDFLITLAMHEGVSLDWLLLGRGRPHRR